MLPVCGGKMYPKGTTNMERQASLKAYVDGLVEKHKDHQLVVKELEAQGYEVKTAEYALTEVKWGGVVLVYPFHL